MNTESFADKTTEAYTPVTLAKYHDIPVAGIQPLTTIDFPGRLAAVIFTCGCPWNCRYCHNSSLRASGESIEWEGIEDFFRARVGFLEGVVLSGGEPTLHPHLPDLLAWLRELGYAVALHTNGFNPAMLLNILRKNLLDYVAMDIKAPPAVYDRVTRTPNSCIEASRSIKIILDSGVNYEFRTTWHPAVLSEYELLDIIRVASMVGVRSFFIQRFRSDGVADRELTEYAALPQNVLDTARNRFPVFDVR